MPTHRGGFILVELLMALIIGVLLIAVVFSTFRTVTLALEGQRSRDTGSRSVARALEEVRADLNRAFLPIKDDACMLVLAEDEREPKSSVLNFCASLPDETKTDQRFARIRRITYNLGGPDGATLIRGEQALSGPGALEATTSRELTKGLARFRVSIFDGVEWQPTWAADPEKSKPLAGRIELQAVGTTNIWMIEVPIPAGMVITSSITRAAL